MVSNEEREMLAIAAILARMAEASSTPVPGSSSQESNSSSALEEQPYSTSNSTSTLTGQLPSSSRSVTDTQQNRPELLPESGQAVQQPDPCSKRRRETSSPNNRQAKRERRHDSITQPFDGRSSSGTQGSSVRSGSSRSFCLINRLCRHDDVIFKIATEYVKPRDMFNLYCISKTFYYIVNHKLPSYILASARRWGDVTPPGNPRTSPSLRPRTAERYDITTQLPFNAYRYLCVIDPSFRIVSRGATGSTARHVPSFKYLFFIVYRAKTIKSICYQMALRSVRLPLDIAPSVLAKIWFTMDIATNATRLALFHNPVYWTNNDIYVAMLICMRIDMVFSDPIQGEDGRAEAQMRQMMLSQRSLTTLNRVLRREQLRTRVELLRMWAEWKFIPSPKNRHLPVFGLPSHRVGRLQFEGWGLGSPTALSQTAMAHTQHPATTRPTVLPKMLRPDQLIVGESVRRGLHLETHLMDMLFWGFIDSDTLEDVKHVEPRVSKEDNRESVETDLDNDEEDNNNGWYDLE